MGKLSFHAVIIRLCNNIRPDFSVCSFRFANWLCHAENWCFNSQCTKCNVQRKAIILWFNGLIVSGFRLKSQLPRIEQWTFTIKSLNNIWSITNFKLLFQIEFFSNISFFIFNRLSSLIEDLCDYYILSAVHRIEKKIDCLSNLVFILCLVMNLQKSAKKLESTTIVETKPVH